MCSILFYRADSIRFLTRQVPYQGLATIIFSNKTFGNKTNAIVFYV